MATTLTHPATNAAPAVRPSTSTAWPWAGLVAGVAGTIATLVLNVAVPTEEQADAGVDAVYGTLDNHTAVGIGASLGFVAVWALVVFAAGFTRHVTRRSPEGSLLPSVVRMALTGGIGSLIVGFGLKAAAAGGMPGGIDEAFYTKSDSTVTALISSQMQWVGWQGVAIAMAATAYGTFRYGLAARWIGAIAAIFTLFVAVFTVVLCLPYSAGIVAPPFLVLLSIALLTTRKFRS
jgi:hypothetical protein